MKEADCVSLVSSNFGKTNVTLGAVANPQRPPTDAVTFSRSVPEPPAEITGVSQDPTHCADADAVIAARVAATAVARIAFSIIPPPGKYETLELKIEPPGLIRLMSR
jgi:hypothetical protein